MRNKAFLTEEQEKRVVNAIARAENRTSGELRVHIEHHCEMDPLERAAAIFHDLGMNETEQQNGVLIYIATEDQKVTVYAGKGILQQVEDNFWEDVLNILLDHFKEGSFQEGIEAAVDKVGRQLKELFPYRQGDVNELPDEISYNNNK